MIQRVICPDFLKLLVHAKDGVEVASLAGRSGHEHDGNGLGGEKDE